MKVWMYMGIALLLGGFPVSQARGAGEAAETSIYAGAPDGRRDDIERIVRDRYRGARILDRDFDDGHIEVKITHKGLEKILILDTHDRWLRTIWEVRREQLPRAILRRLERVGFSLRHIDDNDNRVVENAKGLFFAVQAERGDHDYVFIISDKGRIAHYYRDSEWDDDRWRGEWEEDADWWDDGEDHFDEGDDEWDDFRGRRGHFDDDDEDDDDGEDRFDEGDDEWDDFHLRHHREPAI